MALSIQVPGASFGNILASLSLPDRTGLVGEWVFGTDAAKSTINRANPSGPAATVTGTPTYGAGYARVASGPVAGSHGFDTGITLGAAGATLISVWKKNTSCPVLLGSLNVSYEGFTNYLAVPALFNSQGGALANVADMPVPAHTDYSFMAGAMPLGGLGVIHMAASGSITTATAEVAGGATRTGATLKIGTTISNGGVGIADIAYSAVFHRVLNGTEIAAAYASLKAYMAIRGLVVS